MLRRVEAIILLRVDGGSLDILYKKLLYRMVILRYIRASSCGTPASGCGQLLPYGSIMGTIRQYGETDQDHL